MSTVKYFIQNSILELMGSLTSVNVLNIVRGYVEQSAVVITTMTGKVLQQFDLEDTKGQVLWDTRTIENGIYFYALKQGTITLASGKVSIIK